MKPWLFLSLAAALALTGCVDRQAQKQAKSTQKIVSDPTQVVDVVSVKPQVVSETLEITGEVTTSLDADVGAKHSGKLVAVYVKDGDAVTAGQVLAAQDTTNEQAQLQQAMAALQGASSQLSQAIANAKFGPSKSAAAVRGAEAQLRSAKATLAKVKAGARSEERIQTEWQVKQAKANLDTAKKDLDRKQTLADEGAIPRNQLDLAQNAYMTALSQYNAALQNRAIQVEGARPEDIAVAQEGVMAATAQLKQARDQQKLDVLFKDQVNTAEATVEGARAQVEIARQALDDAQIKAPFAGRVSGKPAQPGQVVGPGTTVARIVALGAAYFEGQVPESEIVKISPGRPVAVSISAIPGRTFQGHVAAVNPVGTDVGRLFNVRVALDTTSPEIKPGMFAKGLITLRTIPDAIMVPSNAVVPYQNHQVVWVLNGASGVKALQIQTGLRQGDDVQIVSGLAPGEKLVVRGQDTLTEKSKVRVENSKPIAATPSKGAQG